MVYPDLCDGISNNFGALLIYPEINEMIFLPKIGVGIYNIKDIWLGLLVGSSG